MSKTPDTATTTQTKDLPQYVQDAQQNLIGTGQQLTYPFLQTPAYSVAGLNADQLAAIQGSRDMYLNEQNSVTPTGQANYTGSTAAQLNPADIQKFQNPYNQQVLDTTFANMRKQYDTSDADLGAKYAAAGAYGGSREAVARSQNQQNFQGQVAQTAAQLMAQGYSQAQAAALANAQMQQQAGLQNASSANSMAQFNANNQMTSNNTDFQRQMQTLQQLMGYGTQQQQLSQQAINAPFTALQQLQGATPSLNNTGSTTTTNTPVQDNTLGTLFGGLMTLGGLGKSSILGSMLLSDEDTKTNIEELGKDQKTGLRMIAYDDKSDIARAKQTGKPMPPKRVSAVAQEVEKKAPGAVRKIGGKRVIQDGGPLRQLLGIDEEAA